jgi:hypothetical protein
MFTVDIHSDSIVLMDEKGEIVYWDRQEWIDDPSLVLLIANAINQGHINGGSAVRLLINIQRARFNNGT